MDRRSNLVGCSPWAVTFLGWGGAGSDARIMVQYYDEDEGGRGALERALAGKFAGQVL